MSEATPNEGAMTLDESAQALESLLFPEPEAEATEEAVDTEAQADVEPEESEEVESEEVETDEAEAEPEEASTEDAPEEDAESVELSPEELAEVLGIEADALSLDEDGNIKLKAKIDGETSEVSLSDLRKSYQLEGHVNKKSMELAEHRKAFEAEAQAQSEAFGQRLQQAEALVTHLEQQMMGEYQGINWEQLRVENPAEFAAKRQELGEKYQQLEQVKASVQHGQEQYMQEAQAKQQEELQTLMAQEQALLFEKLPEFGNETTRKDAQAKLRTYLNESGFSDDEIAQAADHRLIVMADKARKFDELQKKKPEVEKKVKRVPKVTKPGVKKTKTDMKTVQRKKAKANLKKKGGSLDAVAEYLLNR